MPSAQGADAIQGRAFETGARFPYQPLVDALRPRLERENAPEALHLYESLCFEVWGREPDSTSYEGHRYDEIYMTLKL